MDLSEDLRCIQSLLTDLFKNIGAFTRINYKGGNEEKILQIIIKIQEFLANKKYITDDKPNEEFEEPLNSIIYFLAINTSYTKPIEVEDTKHLIGLIPPLSKCVFVNILFGLNLIAHYCTIIRKLPVRNCVELLDETIVCLKKMSPKQTLNNTILLLEAACDNLSNTEFSFKYEDDIDNMSEVTNIILLNLGGIYFNNPNSLKSKKIYEHMGYCLLGLFNLLLKCNQDLLTLSKLLKNVIRLCTSVVRSITLDVFCTWAEIEEDDEVLQSVVAEKAYKVLQKYHNYSDAKELISTLSSIARKPKTVAEKLRIADVDTIIKNVDKVDNDQIKWFAALLASFQVTQNEMVLKCIKKWYKLCREDDITQLLNMYVQNHDESIKEIILNAALILPTEKLLLVCTRHFYTNKYSHVLTLDLDKQLILNKLRTDSDASKEFIWMFLQNPKTVIEVLYIEYFMSPERRDTLEASFELISEMSRIENIGASILLEVMRFQMKTNKECDSYIKLLRVLYCMGYLIDVTIWKELFYPLLMEHKSASRCEDLQLILSVILGADIKIFLSTETVEVIELILDISQQSRTNFLEYTELNQRNLEYSVDIILNLCQPNDEVQLSLSKIDCYMEYYLKYLRGERNASFFLTVCNDFEMKNHSKNVTKILKILPNCVTREWLMVVEELVQNIGYLKCVEILVDVIVLLSQLVQTQEFNNMDASMVLAFRQCLHDFSHIMVKKILPNTTVMEEIEVDKLLCRLLSKLPELLKESEGLPLIALFTERSLKAVANNKDFLCRLMLIKHAKICKILAEKIST